MATDVASAYRHTMTAAAKADRMSDAQSRIAGLMESATHAGTFAAGIIRQLRAIESTPVDNPSTKAPIKYRPRQ
jgi:hypothetical protein